MSEDGSVARPPALLVFYDPHAFSDASAMITKILEKTRGVRSRGLSVRVCRVSSDYKDCHECSRTFEDLEGVPFLQLNPEMPACKEHCSSSCVAVCQAAMSSGGVYLMAISPGLWKLYEGDSLDSSLNILLPFEVSFETLV